jgi:hypothetical protein
VPLVMRDQFAPLAPTANTSEEELPDTSLSHSANGELSHCQSVLTEFLFLILIWSRREFETCSLVYVQQLASH